MINKVILIGRMVRDAELKYTAGSGTATASFTLAVDDGFGEKKTTQYIPCVVWKKTAEFVAQYLGKGRLVYVEGKINVRSYDNKEGKKVYVTEVVAWDVKALEKNPNGQKDMTAVDVDVEHIF